ncbi:MAG TPA: glutamine amidotransferase [Gammaproteobacteria bacterium]
MPYTVALRHVAFEDLGSLEPILRARGHSVRYVEAPVDELSDPDIAAADLLVVLGGPVGVYEDDRYPFLRAEKALLERRLAAGRATLGICLGSQLMASALGARVYPSGAKEIGWAPVDLTAEGARSCLRHLDGTAVLHWHGDTFDLPNGAVRLASTPLCVNQAFSFEKHGLALQFHVEAGGRALERWFVGHTVEIAATPGVEVANLRGDTERWTPLLEPRARACLEEWLAENAL